MKRFKLISDYIRRYRPSSNDIECIAINSSFGVFRCEIEDVLSRRDDIVGIVLLRQYCDIGYEIVAFEVDREFRGRKYGQTLMFHLYLIYETYEFKTYPLYSATGFYKKLGFVPKVEWNAETESYDSVWHSSGYKLRK